ncbi:MAG: TolC family protein [Desulfobacterales bacterium]
MEEKYTCSRNVSAVFWGICFFLIFWQGFLVIRNASCQTDSRHYFTLDRAIQQALSSNLGLKSAQEDIRAAMARKNSRRTEFFPTFNLTYQYLRNDDDLNVTEFGTIRPQNEYSWRAKFTQPVFTGFSILNRFKISEMALQASKAGEQAFRQDLIFSTMDAYFSLLKAIKLWEIAQETIAEIESQREVAENYYEVGITPLNDLLQVEVELANARQLLIISQNNLQTAEAFFNTLLRRPINAPIYVDDIIYYEPFEYDIEYCFSEAEKNRHELDIADLNLQIAEKEFEIAKKDFFPRITLEGQYLQQGPDWDASGGLGIFGESSSWTVTAVATWNFFEWGRTYYGAEEQLYRASQARLEKNQLLDNIRLEVKESYLKMRESEKNIKAVEVAIKQAEENFRIFTEQYKEQMATQTDVLIAQTLLSRTRINYYNALYEYEIAKAGLYRAMGGLDSMEKPNR